MAPADPVGAHLIRSTLDPEPTAQALPARPAARPALSAEPTAHRASAVPVREVGTRTRAGNAMARTRRALLVGAAAAVASHGTRVSMAEVAAASGVAKATLYNHLRTRDDVLAAVLSNEVQRVCDETGELPLVDALAAAAAAISAHPIRRVLATAEPEVLARMARIDSTAEVWQRARVEVTARLVAAHRGGIDVVLRFLSSYLTSPGDPVGIRAEATALLDGLPAA